MIQITRTLATVIKEEFILTKNYKIHSLINPIRDYRIWLKDEWTKNNNVKYNDAVFHNLYWEREIGHVNLDFASKQDELLFRLKYADYI